MLKPRLQHLKRLASTLSTSPHPSLQILPDFLAPSAQRVVLAASLGLLAAPSRSTSHARKVARQWRRSNPTWTPEEGFMATEAYEFQKGHFDGVIEGYREMLVREGMFDTGNEELAQALQRLYQLLPAASRPSVGPSPPSPVDPPFHLLMHLLHLAPHGHIRPHVDNKEAFGQTIVGLSLGGKRVMRFRKAGQVQGVTEATEGGPEQFDVLLRPGDAYVQSEPLRTYYTHEILEKSEWEERQVGGTQRLSIMLRDKLPPQEGRGLPDVPLSTGGMPMR